MGKTTTELTNEYINEHPYIKSCLKKELINYSSLSRMIAQELGIGKKTSMEAILIAARRFKEKLKKDEGHEKKIKDLLVDSEIEIKNKIIVFILEKTLNFESLDELQKKIKKESGTFYLLEGSDNYTLITQEKYSDLINKNFKLKLIKSNKGLALINLKTSKEIEKTPGVLAFITSLFAENSVNIIEFLSCWTDTLFIIDAKDINKAIEFLRF